MNTGILVLVRLVCTSTLCCTCSSNANEFNKFLLVIVNNFTSSEVNDSMSIVWCGELRPNNYKENYVCLELALSTPVVVSVSNQNSTANPVLTSTYKKQNNSEVSTPNAIATSAAILNSTNQSRSYNQNQSNLVTSSPTGAPPATATIIPASVSSASAGTLAASTAPSTTATLPVATTPTGPTAGTLASSTAPSTTATLPVATTPTGSSTPSPSESQSPFCLAQCRALWLFNANTTLFERFTTCWQNSSGGAVVLVSCPNRSPSNATRIWCVLMSDW